MPSSSQQTTTIATLAIAFLGLIFFTKKVTTTTLYECLYGRCRYTPSIFAAVLYVRLHRCVQWSIG